MSTYFNENGLRDIGFSLDKKAIKEIKESWETFVTKISGYPGGYSGQGVVICAGGYKYFTCAWILISMLRKQGCILPIELWYSDGELSGDMIVRLGDLGVECRNLSDFADSAKGFIVKPLAILNSKFEEILFLDADNIAVRDPSYLFENENYRKTGTIFWPDYWKTPRKNPIWEIIGRSYSDNHEQESGQILINKKKCWKELNLCLFFNENATIYYNLLYGDKDTFRFAWMALNTEFFMIETELASCGYIDPADKSFNGITMVQYDAHGKVLFMHRNQLKWDITLDDEMVWEVIKRFKYSSKKRHYLLKRSRRHHNSMDFNGNVETLDFKNEFPNLEKECLAFLKGLREMDFYKEILSYFYLLENRAPPSKL